MIAVFEIVKAGKRTLASSLNRISSNQKMGSEGSCVGMDAMDAVSRQSSVPNREGGAVQEQRS